MAITTYLGVDGNWTNNANWSDGSAPDSGDTAVIPALGTPKTLSSNLDLSASDLTAIIVQPHSNVTIGASGNPLKCAAGRIIHAGDRPFYLKAEHATADIDEIEVNSDNKTLAMEIDDDATAQNLHIRVLKGVVNTTAAITSLPFIEVGRRTSPDSDAVVNIATHATNTVGKLVMSGGTVTVTTKEITDAIVAGGLLIVEGTEVVTNLYSCGGMTHYNTTGTLTRGVCVAGVLDFNQTWAAKTVTTLSGVNPGRILLNNGVAITTSIIESGVSLITSGGGTSF